MTFTALCIDGPKRGLVYTSQYPSFTVAGIVATDWDTGESIELKKTTYTSELFAIANRIFRVWVSEPLTFEGKVRATHALIDATPEDIRQIEERPND
jgi:hypothetical protein